MGIAGRIEPPPRPSLICLTKQKIKAGTRRQGAAGGGRRWQGEAEKGRIEASRNGSFAGCKRYLTGNRNLIAERIREHQTRYAMHILGPGVDTHVAPRANAIMILAHYALIGISLPGPTPGAPPLRGRELGNRVASLRENRASGKASRISNPRLPVAFVSAPPTPRLDRWIIILVDYYPPPPRHQGFFFILIIQWLTLSEFLICHFIRYLLVARFMDDKFVS
jgi:hypothetical protein